MNNPEIYLKKYRKQFEISQKKLSKDLKISQGYISSIESGLKSPTLRMLYKIANYLQICPCLLLSCKINCKNCIKFKCKCEVNNNDYSNIQP